MANLLDNCETCYEAKLNECVDLIVIAGGFTVGALYLIVITDKFGNEYRLIYTTDYGGNLAIDVTDLPEGLFTAHSGVFTVIIYGDDGCTPVDITLCDMVYTCIKMSFKTVYDGNAEAVITEVVGCCEDSKHSILINKITQQCFISTPYLLFNITVVGITGTCEIQAFSDALVWTAIASGLNITEATTFLGPYQGISGNRPYRIVSGEVISNEMNFTQTICP